MDTSLTPQTPHFAGLTPGDAQPLPLPPPTTAQERTQRGQRAFLTGAQWALAVLTGIGTNVVMGLAVAFVLTILALSVGPRFLPYQTSTVVTGSMVPTLPVGTIVVLRPVDASQLAVGDVITFQHPDRPSELLTHRIVGITAGEHGQLFQTQGDANALPDSWLVVGAGTGWRCVYSFPRLGNVLRIVQSPHLRSILISLSALGLGLLFLRDIWRPKTPQRVAA